MTTIPDHIVPDTHGMILEAQIQPADIQDRDDALLVHHLPLNAISTVTRTMVPLARAVAAAIPRIGHPKSIRKYYRTLKVAIAVYEPTLC